jgi:hypothetical protein
MIWSAWDAVSADALVPRALIAKAHRGAALNPH